MPPSARITGIRFSASPADSRPLSPVSPSSAFIQKYTAVTATKPCEEAGCDHAPWLPAGSAVVVDVTTRAVTKIALTSTMDADVRLGSLTQM